MTGAGEEMGERYFSLYRQHKAPPGTHPWLCPNPAQCGCSRGRQFPGQRLETQQLLAELKITLETSNHFQVLLCPEGQEGKDLSPIWKEERGEGGEQSQILEAPL